MTAILKITSSVFKHSRGIFVRKIHVLGIETSCDDTGIAIVDCSGKVLANVLDSQQKVTTRYGGIIPPRAQTLHRDRIAGVFERCIQASGIQPEQLHAIAVTNRPGLPMSLQIGLRFAKHLGRKYNKPLVPIHHMEAHALQARMEHKIPFPFLCLLISGGHCQLTFVSAPQRFQLLGEALDDAPGEALDKISRRLRLHLIPKYRYMSGGQAIEDAAKTSQNPDAFEFPLLLAQQRNCNFSFSGLKNTSIRAIKQEESKQGTPPDCLIENYVDFCAGVLRASSRHLMQRTQRALEYCIARNLFDDSTPRSLVVSGGVANNDFIYAELAKMAAHFNCAIFRPSKKYCSDNGVMIAWNAIEQLLVDESCLRFDYDAIDVKGKVQLGESLIEDVENANLKCKWVKVRKANLPLT